VAYGTGGMNGRVFRRVAVWGGRERGDGGSSGAGVADQESIRPMVAEIGYPRRNPQAGVGGSSLSGATRRCADEAGGPRKEEGEYAGNLVRTALDRHASYIVERTRGNKQESYGVIRSNIASLGWGRGVWLMAKGRFRLSPTGNGIGSALRLAFEHALILEDDDEEVRRMRELLNQIREMRQEKRG
jgi:hypothetical protein